MNECASDSGTTAVKSGIITDKKNFRLQNGKLHVQFAKSVTAKVVQLDYQGRVLWQSATRQFSPGEYEIDVPETNTKTRYRVETVH